MTETTAFAMMHFSMAFTVACLLTGDIIVGGAVALVEPAVNTVACYFHDRAWWRFESAESDRGLAAAWRAATSLRRYLGNSRRIAHCAEPAFS